MENFRGNKYDVAQNLNAGRGLKIFSQLTPSNKKNFKIILIKM